MPYLNVDDGMDEHPKVEALSDGAFRLHVRAMLYCARKGTDGYVSRAKAKELGSDALAAELTRVAPLAKSPTWHDLGQGCGTSTCPAGVKGYYVIHDYLEWNHSAHWWEKKRKEDAERLRKWRASRKKPDDDGVT